jgi:hypothetical protein
MKSLTGCMPSLTEKKPMRPKSERLVGLAGDVPPAGGNLEEIRRNRLGIFSR